MSEVDVQRFYGDRLVDEVHWAELVEVIVETNDRGPFFVDLFLVLVEAGGGTVHIPSDLFTDVLLVDHIL